MYVFHIIPQFPWIFPGGGGVPAPFRRTWGDVAGSQSTAQADGALRLQHTHKRTHKIHTSKMHTHARTRTESPCSGDGDMSFALVGSLETWEAPAGLSLGLSQGAPGLGKREERRRTRNCIFVPFPCRELRKSLDRIYFFSENMREKAPVPLLWESRSFSG